MKADGKGKQGFALVVVLFSLVVLTALFAVAQSRSLAHLQSSAAERVLLTRGAETRDLLDPAIAWRLSPAAEGRPNFRVVLADGEGEVFLQDVGGLVDLNTAAPGLLAAFALPLEIDDGGLARYRDWRRTPRRLLRVADFQRIAGGVVKAPLDLVATVYSGRSGIAVDVAPAEVVSLLTESTSGALPEEFSSAPSGANYLVILRRDTSEQRLLLGTIHIGPDRAQSRVLAVAR